MLLHNTQKIKVRHHYCLIKIYRTIFYGSVHKIKEKLRIFEIFLGTIFIWENKWNFFSKIYIFLFHIGVWKLRQLTPLSTTFFWGGLFLTSNVGWCAGLHEFKSFFMCAHCDQWLGFFWNKTNYLMIYKYFIYLLSKFLYEQLILDFTKFHFWHHYQPIYFV